MRHLIIVISLCVLFDLCGANIMKENANVINPINEEVKMKINSSAFKQGESIPKKYTCQGEDVSPPLTFHDIPKGTKSFALIMDDPDAPMGTFDHWLAWNIPGDTKELAEGVVLSEQGINHFKKTRYGGPCPPPGKPHRYYFKVYALDSLITLPKGSTKQQLKEAIKEHILGEAELMGIFQR